MEKQEFDRASREAGYGTSADYMWPEIERCYSASDRIDRALMVYIYWNEPGIYRAILGKREEIDARVVAMKAALDGYGFAQMPKFADELKQKLAELDSYIDAALWRREKKTEVK